MNECTNIDAAARPSFAVILVRLGEPGAGGDPGGDVGDAESDYEAPLGDGVTGTRMIRSR